jgi:hypothetical protein
MVESTEPTPYAVTCPTHGRVYLTRGEYDRQMENGDVRWKCPRFVNVDPIGPCGEESEFDDGNYELALTGPMASE